MLKCPNITPGGRRSRAKVAKLPNGQLGAVEKGAGRGGPGNTARACAVTIANGDCVTRRKVKKL